MKYNIMVISDLHWGVINPQEQLKSLEFIFEFIDRSSKENIGIDLLVIAGDYFDGKLPLNSQEAIIAIQWFHRLYNTCFENGICIRMFQGTMDHDNDQLDVFESLTKREEPRFDKFFQIFKATTVEETLPDLLCCYCPDETIQADDYEERYFNEIMQLKDIGFFHGSFDVVYGELLARNPDMMKRNNVIYRYNLWNTQIKGPMIAGHWHDGKQYDELYYCGSPFRWKFNEDEEKGFLFIQYNTEDSSYLVKKIINPLCAEYLTYEVYSNLYETKEDYVSIVNDIKIILEKLDESSLNNKLRILVYLVDDKPENDVFLSALRQEIINRKNCKITVKNRLKNKKKKEKMKERQEEDKKYGFIYHDNTPSEIIHKFIEIDNEVDIPIDYIASKIKKYV